MLKTEIRNFMFLAFTFFLFVQCVHGFKWRYESCFTSTGWITGEYFPSKQMATFSTHLLAAAPREKEYPREDLHMGLWTEVWNIFSKYILMSVTILIILLQLLKQIRENYR